MDSDEWSIQGLPWVVVVKPRGSGQPIHCMSHTYIRTYHQNEKKEDERLTENYALRLWRWKGAAVSSQQIFIGFANLYRRFIQDFSKIVTSLIAMLKTTGSSIASAFRVDDNEVVSGGDGARAKSGGSVYQWIHQTIQVTRRCSKTSWERFDSSRRFCWLMLAWNFTVSSADIRFASERLTRLETIKRVKLLNNGLRDNDKKLLWLGPGGHVDGRSSAVGKSVKKSSKSRQKSRRIVKEPKKLQGLKNLQRTSVRRNLYQSTGPLSTKNLSFR